MMTSIDFLHPELLSNETLRDILKERKVKINGVCTMHRDELLQLYHQFCMPLAQRKRKSDKFDRNERSIAVISPDKNIINKRLIEHTSPVNHKKLKLNRCADTHIDSHDMSNNNKHELSLSDKEKTDFNNESKRQKTKITWP